MAVIRQPFQESNKVPGGSETWTSRRLLSKFKDILFDPKFTLLVGSVTIFIDFILSAMVIRFVNYTEIDWTTYMEQIDKFLNGTRDYSQIHGSTGPLVYPAGHLYIFTILRFLTGGGQIFSAQLLFLIVYIFNAFLVVAIYNKLQQVPPYALVLMFLSSYRVHSIFVLRLFNDPIAVTIFHSSLLCFLHNKWMIGCIIYSVAVSVKMNILLFAPGLLLILLENLLPIRTAACLMCCAAVQFALGLPFLMHSPVNYVRGAFDLSRVFLFKWTVNWRFVPEQWFTSRTFHFCLLLGHVVALSLMFRKRWSRAIGNLLSWQTCRVHIRTESQSSRLMLTLFAVNLIGILFSRSLHYQFYVWYFYSIPALLWSTSFWIPIRLSIMLLMELCWNTYPSSNWSSLLLLSLHVLILAGVAMQSSGRKLSNTDSGDAVHHKHT